MPTIRVRGHDVKVGDEFLRLSDEEKQKAVNEIAATLPSGLARQIDLATRPLTSYVPTQMKMAQESLDQVEHGLGQLAGHGEEGGTAWERAKGAGNVALGGLGYATSPINAGLQTFIGQPIEDLTSFPKEYTNFAAGLMLPIPKSLPPGMRPPARFPEPLPARPGGVTLSQGQLTQDLPTIQFEQAGARGQLGAPAQRNAAAFGEQQRGELAAARKDITDEFKPAGAPDVDSMREAAGVVQQGLQQRAGAAKANVTSLYDTARDIGGEIHAGAFEGMPQRIKGELMMGDRPVIVDPMLTPYADHMLQDLERNVGRLNIPNRADPFGAPNPENITAVSLKGVEQWRKRLSKLRGDAMASGNASDSNAARAVLNSFDDQIEAAVNGGLFNGDPRAVQAWNDARAAHSDYRSTFTASGAGGRRDPVGAVIEKIIGKGDRSPAAIPNDVSDFLVGGMGINPNSLNAHVVDRLRDIFGERSPEWSAIKQGLFKKLTESGDGMTPWGPGKVAQRLNQFLNNDGIEMAQRLFTAPERRLMQSYADVLRHLEVPQAGANWSNTATFTGQGFKPGIGAKLVDELGMLVATTIGGPLGHIPGVGKMLSGAVEHVAGMPAQARDAAQIARQMPIIANVVRDFTRAQQVYGMSQSAANAARLALATRNLASNLQDVGISLSDILNPPAEQRAAQ